MVKHKQQQQARGCKIFFNMLTLECTQLNVKINIVFFPQTSQFCIVTYYILFKKKKTKGRHKSPTSQFSIKQIFQNGHISKVNF